MKEVIHQRLTARLRDKPIPATVPGSLPVLFFGDLLSARIATISINPSRQECLSREGEELDGVRRRFETFRSLEAADRASLSDEQTKQAIDRIHGYFDHDESVYSWFNGLIRVIEGMGYSYSGHSAAHLDIVQEATDPTWSKLKTKDRGQADIALQRDLQFLQWQIESFPLRAIVCTSAIVQREVAKMLPVRTVHKGALARVQWTASIAETPRGPIGVAGWNLTLAHAGLTREEQRELGVILIDCLDKIGYAP